MNDQVKPGRTGAVAILLLAIVGLGLSGYLTLLHVQLHHDPTYVSVCAIGDKLNCETVAASRYSVALGLPVSVWGALSYLILAWMSFSSLSRKRSGGRSGFLALYGLMLIAISIVLAAISAFVIGAVCLLCSAVYLINLVVATIAVARARGSGGLVVCVTADVRDTLAWPGPAARRLAIVLAALAAVHVFVPRYWEMAAWRHGTIGASGTTDEGYPWIGAQDPKLAIHEYLDYECPHCKYAHHKLRRLVSEHSDEIRLVRHDYARMACKPNDPQLRRSSCELARAGFCAARFGRFWEWNDAVIAQPRPLKGEERQTYVTDMARQLDFDLKAFDACLFDADTIDRAHSVFIDARARRILETPSYVVDQRKRKWEELLTVIDERL